MEFYSGFETQPKNKRAKKVATKTTEAPNLTDEKGRPMTYWGGLAEPNQDTRLYSEEEVIDLLVQMNSWPTIFDGKEDITEWLEQLKNK